MTRDTDRPKPSCAQRFCGPISYRCCLSAGLASLLAGLAPAQAAGPLPVPSGVFVTAGSALPPQISGATMNVRQLTPSVSLNWDRFNIDPGYTVNFAQPGATAIALNYIKQGDPAQIRGQLNANGEVWLLNQNGIVFGKGAQVNVRGLVASTLNPTADALASGIAPPTAQGYSGPAFAAALDGAGKPLSKDLSVEQGATIATNGPNGRVFLFAPNVTNAGTITAQDGQIALAAGSEIYIRQPQTGSGLVVEVGKGGVVTNGTAANAGVTDPTALLGQVVADHGTATLVGLSVNQLGRVSASSAVKTNGTVRLLARNAPGAGGNTVTLDPVEGGTLTLGANSVTAANPDPADSTTAVDASANLPGNVTLAGQAVIMKAGSSVTAHGGAVKAIANEQGDDAAGLVADAPGDSQSRIVMEAGSRIDVSGADATVDASRNTLTVKLQGAELKDLPVQRNGVLRGRTVTVDLRQQGTRADGTSWIGTPLADLTSSAAADVKRGLAERNSAGGTVTLQSQGAILLAPGSTVDVSGGVVTHPAGSVQTTLLMRQGRLVDIAHADPNVAYDGVFGDFEFLHTKWGGKDSWSLFSDGSLLSSYAPAYSEGKDAGTISLLAPGMILDGTLRGGTTPGRFQRQASTAVAIPVARAYDQLPLGGRLVLGNGSAPTPDPQYITPDVRLDRGDVFAGLAAFAPETGTLPAAVKIIHLAPEWFGSGRLGALEIYSEGAVTLPAGARLDLGDQGSLKVNAGAIAVAGAIAAPGGSVSLFARGTSDGSGGTPSTGVVTLARGASIDVSGLWTNDTPARNAGATTTAPILTNGGSIELRAQGRNDHTGGLELAADSVLAADGGALLTRAGKVSGGTGGTISLAVQSGDAGAFAVPITLDGALSARALTAGGTLKIGAADFCVAAACGARDPYSLALDPAWFTRGGFASYALTATGGGFDLAPGTTLALRQENFVLDRDYAQHASGGTLREIAAPAVLGDDLRQATNLSVAVEAQNPVNTFDDATLAASGLLSLGAGSRILADPRANVALASDTRLYVNGTIRAPGGNITLDLTSGINGSRLLGFLPSQTLWLGSTAALDVGGTFIDTPNSRGLSFGTIVGGGSVTLAADSGYVVAAAGARLDVRGTAHALDVLPAGAIVPEHRTVAGDSGSITVRAAEGFDLRADLLAAAALPGARAGSLALAVDAQHRNDDANQPAALLALPVGARTLDVLAAEGAWPAGLAAGSAVPADLLGSGRIAQSRITTGGFGDITLEARNYSRDTGAISAPGAIVLDAGTALAASRRLVLDAGGIAVTGGAVQLAAPYLALGNSDDNASGDILDPQAVPALAAGNAVLAASAAQIDFIGALRLNGIANASFTSSGDIRLRGIQTQGGAALDTHYTGSLESTGDLRFASRQLYPATLTEFTLAVRDNPAGRIRFESTAAPGTVLSAGGQLQVIAPYIVQAGTLKAPLGLVSLEAGTDLLLAPGSLTSTSLGGVETLFGQVEVGKDWVYLLDGFKDGSQGRLVFTAQSGRTADPFPGAKVRLQAPAVHLAPGATVDESGGGNLLAYEFQPGLTGSVDALAIANAPQTYAIVPWLEASFAPFDPQEMQGFPLAAGESVELAAGAPGLAAGRYALLPPRFALLPGALLVSQLAGYGDLAPGSAIGLAAGGTVVAGRRVFATGLDGDLRTSGFLVRDATDIAALAKYDLSGANDFAGLTGQRLPHDGGILQIAAGTTLDLGGHLLATPGAGGRGAEAEITGNRLALVNDAAHAAPQAGTLFVDAAGLSGLGAESLVIGATRTDTAGGRTVDVSAESVSIAGGVTLTAPEIILAATSDVSLAAGARLFGTGAASPAPGSLFVNGDGALLRVASGPQATLVRSGESGAAGTLDIAAGAVLAASGTMLLDASMQTHLDGTIAMHGGSLNLGAARITLGTPAFATDGLVLNDALLGALDVGELVLTAREGIDLHGGLDLAFSRLVLETAGLAGYANDGGTARLTAQSIRFGNAGGFTYLAPAGATPGHGTLAIAADDIAFGATDGGGFSVQGFDTVALSASGTLRGVASGSFDFAGALNASAASFGAGASVTTRITSSGAMTLATPAGSTSPVDGLGGALEFTAARIASTAHFTLPAGRLVLHASGAAADDDVTLGAGTSIDVAGRALAFGSTAATAPAGSVQLVSDHGDVVVPANAAVTLDLAGSAAGGDAGTLTLAAPEGRLDGFTAVSLAAGASSGARRGRVSIDVGSLADDAAFGDLLGVLSAAGFNETIDARVRSGNLVLDAANTIAAHSFGLAVDAGDLTIARNIDATGTTGGSIHLAAGGRVTIGDGTTLDAHATAPGGRGGVIEIATAGNGDGTTAAGGIELAAGAKLEVGAGPGGDGGSLQFRLPRADLETLTDAVAANDLLALHGTLTGSASTVVEGFRAYADADGTITAGEAAASAGASGRVSAAATSTSIPTSLSAATNGLYAGLTIRFTSGNLNGRTATITAYDATTKRLTVTGLAGTPSVNSQFVIAGNAYYMDAVAFMSDAGAIRSGLGSAAADAAFHLRPGIEIRSPGNDAGDASSDLTLGALWDLSAWRFGGEPGVLTLRAAGNLLVNDSLSDGFSGTADIAKTLTTAGRTTRCVNPASCTSRPTALPQFLTSESWSYRLVAGADLAGADVLATMSASSLAAARDGAGNLTVAPGTVSSGTALRAIPVAIRTGTGSIEIAAGGALTLSNRASVIYTAGLNTGLGIALGNTSPTSRATLQGRPYPERGGDISITTGGNVNGIAPGTDFAAAAGDFERQLVTSWLFRQGDAGATNRATGWTIAPDYFEQGIGTLAGGNLTVRAGGDLANMSLSVASIGRQVGGSTAQASAVEMIDGGMLDVDAGGSILSGVFYVGKGSASLRAAGDFTSGRPASDTVSDPLYPVLALGDASMAVQAGGRVDLGGVVNPTFLSQGPAQKQVAINAKFNSYFFTYTPASAVTLEALTGDVAIHDTTPLTSGAFEIPFADFDGVGLTVLPPRLSAVALQGNLVSDASFALYPAASGNFSLLAGGSVEVLKSFALSDADVAALPRPEAPGAFGDGTSQAVIQTLLTTEVNASDPTLTLAQTPVHLAHDTTPTRIVARGGDVTSAAGARVFASRPVEVVAGRDIVNLDLIVENTLATDVSVLSAGRDFVYSSPRIARDSALGAPGALLPTANTTEVWGPGRLLIETGRDLELGTAGGILSRGSTKNAALAGEGAAVTVFAGLNGTAPDFAALTANYLGTTSPEFDALTTYVRAVRGDATLAGEAALTAFEALAPGAQAGVVLDAFFRELRETGRAAAASTAPDYSRGERAISTLFPGRNYRGDVNLYFSQIFTLGGGNIDLLVPGGNVNVGLATPPSSFGISKGPSELGIVTEGLGDIRSYLAQDFEVNESRVFAADGGSIFVWSGHGDIDAGRGAKSAISVPANGFQFDNQGRLTVTVPPPIQGSGIRALTTTPGREFGSVDLVTPHGVVNASEAGIESAGNITIAAVQVLGAENIKAGGNSVGVPSVSVGGVSASVAGAGGAASSAAKSASDAAAGSSDRNAAGSQPLGTPNLSLITVEVLGFGG